MLLGLCVHYLIEDGDRLILIDNGIGDKQDDKFLKHYYLHGDVNLHSSLAIIMDFLQMM